LAAMGIEFPLALAREVVRKPEDELNRMLRDLQLAEFIYEQPAIGEVEYTFRHALTHEVAYNSLLIERRRALHERTAKAIEELYSDRLEGHVVELAHHYGCSTNAPKALEYLERAGEQARRRSAYTEAIAHFRRGLELLAHLPEDRERDKEEARLQNRLAFSLLTEGYSASEARQAYARAKELSEQHGDRRQLLEALADLAHFYMDASDLKKHLEISTEPIILAT